MDFENIFVDKRTKSLFDSPKVGIGNKPIDDGNYLFTETEMLKFIKDEPDSKRFFRPWYGTKEFTNKSPRYCLFLGDVEYDLYRDMPKVLKLVDNVVKFRKSSSSAPTRKLAEKPTIFHVTNLQLEDYRVIPRLIPHDRVYLPLGFLCKDCLASDSVHIVSNCKLYHFGILSSKAHMEWVKTFSGRRGKQIRYSAEVVYNNFPWPNPTETQKQKIEETAQHILDVRDKYRDKTYIYLYNTDTMPYDLLSAHEQNDKAVMEAYGLSEDSSSAKILDKLIKMYAKRIEELEINEKQAFACINNKTQEVNLK